MEESHKSQTLHKSVPLPWTQHETQASFANSWLIQFYIKKKVNHKTICRSLCVLSNYFYSAQQVTSFLLTHDAIDYRVEGLRLNLAKNCEWNWFLFVSHCTRSEYFYKATDELQICQSFASPKHALPLIYLSFRLRSFRNLIKTFPPACRVLGLQVVVGNPRSFRDAAKSESPAVILLLMYLQFLAINYLISVTGMLRNRLQTASRFNKFRLANVPSSSNYYRRQTSGRHRGY